MDSIGAKRRWALISSIKCPSSSNKINVGIRTTSCLLFFKGGAGGELGGQAPESVQERAKYAAFLRRITGGPARQLRQRGASTFKGSGTQRRACVAGWSGFMAEKARNENVELHARLGLPVKKNAEEVPESGGNEVEHPPNAHRNKPCNVGSGGDDPVVPGFPSSNCDGDN